MMKKRFTKNKRIGAAMAVVAIALATCWYFSHFHISGETGELERAIEEEMGIPVKITKTTVMEEGEQAGKLRIVMCEGTDQSGINWHGVAGFQKGLLGRYALIGGTLFDYHDPIQEATIGEDRSGIFGDLADEKAVTVFFSQSCPKETDHFLIKIYDAEKWMETGEIVSEEHALPVTDGRMLEPIEVSFHFYDRNMKAYDEEGNQLDLKNYYHNGNGNSKGRSVTEPSSLADSCCVILILGMVFAVYFWRKDEN